ncbi:putative adhesin [Inquilinus limosus]|uniref:putative adhesin n=1 Tax=Inquilinus limosus TaxID=171674 RepID=UPI00041BB823|nr:hypothetical protein [Inquilinus limosus]
MPLTQNIVGDHLRVWTRTAGRPSTQACAISAHGTDLSPGRTLRAPDVTLVYYTPHGITLPDPSLERFTAGALRQVETLRTADSPDYALSKYTNSQTEGGRRHNQAGESYASVAALPETMAGKAQTARDNAAAFRSAGQESYALAYDADEALYAKGCQYDVVTIRNRAWRTSFNPLTLSEVITTLWNAGYRYSTIHCVFCRGGG